MLLHYSFILTYQLKRGYMMRIFYLCKALSAWCKSLSLCHGILLQCSISLMKCHSKKNYVFLNAFSKNVVIIDECLMIMLYYFLKTLDLWQDSAIFTPSENLRVKYEEMIKIHKVKSNLDSSKVKHVKCMQWTAKLLSW